MTVQIQQRLLEALKKIDRPGVFCTSGQVPPILPGLEVAGAGAVALPVGKLQAAAIKKQARQAPYGKGTQTLVDTDVRRVWEIDAEQVTLANPQWPDVVEQVVHTVQSELGLEKQNLKAHLYKLLLYEKGSFFLPHRDGEKLDRMVATLVIALPAKHEGGELVVRHEGREEIIDFGPKSPFQTQFAAFYADCEHEVRPLTSGFRLALVYNLTLAKSKRAIAAPTSSERIAAVAQILEKGKGERGKSGTIADSGDEQATHKLAVLLDHKYSQAGLTYDVLKGIDRAKADVLFAAAREAGWDAYLALVTKWESGSAEPSGDYGYRYGRYRNDEEEEGGENGSQYMMGEVFDEGLTAGYFSDADGERMDFGEIPLDDDEIVSENPLNESQPDTEDFEGYTGNAGMTLERWYYRAAVVLWPAEFRFEVLRETGVGAVVGGLEQMVKQWKRAKKSEQAVFKQACYEYAERLIDSWTEQAAGSYYRGESDSSARTLAQLNELGDASLIAAWLRGVLANDYSLNPGKMLGDVCKQHGWLGFQNELLDLFANTSGATVQRQSRLLADWSLRTDKNAVRKEICIRAAQRMMSALECWEPQRSERGWQSNPVDFVTLLEQLAQSFISVEEPELLERLVTYVVARPEVFDLTGIQIPALLRLGAWLQATVKRSCAPLHRWLAATFEQLETRASHPPQKPMDWRRESTTGCDCADCKELIRFLKDPDAETLRLPLAAPRREHLHQIIQRNKIDATDFTERRGRPYTLVCIKTNASYERALQTHQIDLDHLAKIRQLLEWHKSLSE